MKNPNHVGHPELLFAMREQDPRSPSLPPTVYRTGSQLKSTFSSSMPLGVLSCKNTAIHMEDYRYLLNQLCMHLHLLQEFNMILCMTVLSQVLDLSYLALVEGNMVMLQEI